MPKTPQKKKWSAEVAAKSDSLDLEPNVFEKESAEASRPLAQTLRGGERSSQIERFSLCDVDVDLLHQPRRPKPAARAQANP